MKFQQIRLCVLSITVSLTVATVVVAHPDGHESMPPSQPSAPSAPSVQLPAKMVGTLAAINGQFALLKAALAEGKFSAVSSNAVTLNQLVQHIVKQVPGDHQADVKAIAAQHAALTTELTRAAAAGAAKHTTELVSKLGGNLRNLQQFVH